jgi:hypothetical protein
MIIYINGWWHHKNINGINLLENENFQVKQWNGENDGLILLSDTTDFNIVNNYSKVIIGPHIEFTQSINLLNNYNNAKDIYFNGLSSWLVDLLKVHVNNSKCKPVQIPFPIDIYKFIPENKVDNFFIYFKNVHSSRLNRVIECLNNININLPYKIFKYGTYSENEYLEYLKTSKFGIWVGCHESQGFGFQEALSCNCPLFVYDVNSLKDECHNDSHNPWINLNGDSTATSASYFDDTCGMIYKDSENIQEKMTTFLNNINNNLYSPRAYIINTLSPDKCRERLVNFFNS